MDRDNPGPPIDLWMILGIVLVIILACLPFILRYYMCPDYCFADYCGYPPHECMACIYSSTVLVYAVVTFVGLVVLAAVVGHINTGVENGQKVLEEEEEFLYPTPT